MRGYLMGTGGCNIVIYRYNFVTNTAETPTWVIELRRLALHCEKSHLKPERKYGTCT